MVMSELGGQNRCIKIIMIIYVEILEAASKSAIIQNYIETVKTYKSK